MAARTTENPGFSLGEDRPRNANARAAQEERWAHSKVNARQHLSMREALLKHRAVLDASLQDYQVCVVCASAVFQASKDLKIEQRGQGSKESKKLNLGSLGTDVLGMVLEYALCAPGQGGLFRSLSRRRLAQVSHTYISSCPFKICVRKRPLTQAEKESEDFDVLETFSGRVSDSPQNLVVCHNGKLARSGRKLTMTHQEYLVDRVYSEWASNELVCNEILNPLLDHVSHGKNATMVCYGQTGTGKTYTLNGALEVLANFLENTAAVFSITFFEVHGKKCYDLLSDRKPVKLLSDENEQVHARGAKELKLASASTGEVMEVLRDALLLRSTMPTERNKLSSRSHAICCVRLYTRPDGSPVASSNASTVSLTCDHATDSSIENNADEVKAYSSKLTIVDLAGSERNYETVSMTAADHRDSAEVNTSLMTLKDCFRKYHGCITTATSRSMGASNEDIASGTLHKKKKRPVPYSHAPYRNSALTRTLRECFIEGAQHRAVILACVSPTSADMLHTINSLEHVNLMSPRLAELKSTVTVEVPMAGTGSVVSMIPVHDWTHEQVIQWLTTVEGGRFGHVVLPPQITGAQLLMLDKVSLAELFHAQEKESRVTGEGGAWTVGWVSGDGADAARSTYAMLGREIMIALLKERQEINGRILNRRCDASEHEK